MKQQSPPSALLECVPNLSEGRNLEALTQLWDELKQIPELQCLHRCSDPDHHRSVLTLAGPPAPLQQALHQIFAWAQAHIDLRQHQGVHPRIGAVDVIPLVPLQGISEAEAVAFSQALAADLAQRWQVPIYLYEASSRQRQHSALPQIRRGGFEGLSQKMQAPTWQPDFGPQQPHPSLGASVLGVRKILIAWNVWLESQDLELARRIAARLRESGGGFPALRTLGLYLPQQQQVQISMNLLDYHQSGLFAIMDAIRRECATAGVRIAHTEFIGLPPREALLNCAQDYLQTSSDFSEASLLESRLYF